MATDFQTIYGGNKPGGNDAAMAEPSNGGSNLINRGVNWLTEQFGYDSTRRSAADDNPFYRNNAQYMPGWGNTFGLNFMDPNGVPSGATAQDRATNYVGHDDPTGIWADVRRRLVENEGAAIEGLPQDAHGNPVGNIGFGDVYGAHVDAYRDAQTAAREEGRSPDANNPFIDPLSFGLAAYVAPLLEHANINTGPITGASIDFFNDPTDSVGAGWLKRAGLGLGGMALGGLALGPLGMLPGAASLAWNTGTAVDAHAREQEYFGTGADGRGLGVRDWANNVGSGAGDWMRDLTGNNTIGNVTDTVTSGLATVGGGIYAGGRAAIDGIGSLASSAGSAILSFLSDGRLKDGVAVIPDALALLTDA
jgi:hypothetical protein